MGTALAMGPWDWDLLQPAPEQTLAGLGPFLSL